MTVIIKGTSRAVGNQDQEIEKSDRPHMGYFKKILHVGLLKVDMDQASPDLSGCLAREAHG